MSRANYVIAAVLLLSVAALPPAGWKLWSARSAFASASVQLDECQQLAEEIRKLKQEPELISVERRTESQIHADIVACAERYQLPILRISSPVSNQIPNSPYLEQSTSLDIQAVELKQLMRFLKELSLGDDKHDITAIRLTEPRARASEASQVDTWTAELTITSWTYAKE